MFDMLVQILKDRIADTDLEYWVDKDAKLRYALTYAISAVNSRCGFKPENTTAIYPIKYKMNVLEGAVWYLGKIGAEGYSSTSENGVSVSWKETPEWLLSVAGGMCVC